MKKTEILMNNPVYLGISILGLSKILMYEFCFNYVKPKPKYDEKANVLHGYRQFHFIHKIR